MMALWNALQPFLITIAVVLTGRYVVTRVVAEAEQAARLGADKALADHRHEQEKQLARLEAQHQRSFEEFGLYTRKQHQVYAALYRKVRVAADRFSSQIGASISTDFSTFTAGDVQAYVEGNEISPSLGDPVIAAFQNGATPAAVRLMEGLDRKLQRWKAEEAFRQAKNAEALNELYLSDDVREKLALLRSKIAAVSTALQYPEPGKGMDTLAKRDAMNAAVMELYHLMRAELRRGHAEAGTALAPPAA